MNYQIMKLDSRFTYKELFEYCIKFSNSMARGSGPLHFNHALEWFVATYGWSAEVRQYDKMLKWVDTTSVIKSTVNLVNMRHLAKGVLEKAPLCCNPHWSWTNGYDDLRIYVKTAAELNFFQLKFPQDQ